MMPIMAKQGAKHDVKSGGYDGAVIQHCGMVPTSRQFCEERLGFLAAGGVKALGEPAVDLGAQLVGFSTFALMLP